MCALFHSREPEPLPALEPAPGEFPKIEGAEIAATTYGKRVAGDFYDSLRVSPERILFGLLDVAGRREKQSAHSFGRAEDLSHSRSRALFGVRYQRI